MKNNEEQKKTKDEIKQQVCATRCKMVEQYTDYALDEKCAECPLNDL